MYKLGQGDAYAYAEPDIRKNQRNALRGFISGSIDPAMQGPTPALEGESDCTHPEDKD